MSYTQEQLETTVQMLLDFLEAMERKDPKAFNAIPAIRTAGEELGAYDDVAELNEYLE